MRKKSITYFIDILVWDHDAERLDEGFFRLRIKGADDWDMTFTTLEDCYKYIAFFASKYHLGMEVKTVLNKFNHKREVA